MNISDSLPGCRHTTDLTFTPLQVTFRVFVLPFTCLLGLCANLCNVYVFSNKKMRSHLVNYFLLCLAISDAIVLLTSFFVFCFPVIAEYTEDESLVRFAPSALSFFYPLAHTAHTNSVYLTTLVSVHRYLGVCHPFLARRLSNKNVVLKVILYAFVISIGFNVPRWLELSAIPCLSEVWRRKSMMIAPSAFMLDTTYTIVYRNVLYTLLMFCIPFSVLTWVNCRIVTALKLSKIIRKKMTHTFGDEPSASNISFTMKPVNSNGPDSARSSGKSSKDMKKERKETSITIMLVAMVTGFIYFNMLAFINNLFELFGIDAVMNEYYTMLVEGSTFLVCINGASTIVIYLLFSSKYRAIVAKLIMESCYVRFARGLCFKSDEEFRTSASLIRPRTQQRPPRFFDNTNQLTLR
ncbi:unnamed protein product [Bursaphelenchus xylophilus]|uniref:(pine wood nematode) hypothetical protein n=1 Tax=Bursaphelenchus xylophilus TaxID=6326 RepID=A0A1I7RNT0_BURXY|nr:unnamed protein product [Bursaphelenchus xylophilus]CAG9124266.1 unnamed protein product [Bursaphelenchus xylophilus]